MSTDVFVRGGRDVRATLDSVDGDACVVACPPHPQHRGHRGDERLRAVSDALAEEQIDSLRFDYGPWDEGRGERTDAVNAVAQMREAYDHVGLFGYSFGAAVALLAAAETDVGGVSVLAPPARITSALDAVDALERIDVPVQVVYGARDETVEWNPVVDAVRERGGEVTELPADHFFIGQAGTVAEAVAPFFRACLR